MEEKEHREICTDLHSIFRSQLRDVSGDALCGVRVDWEHPTVKPHAPDIAVFFGIPKEGKVPTLYVKQTQAQPAICIEITSPSTRSNDLGKKVGHFEQVGVPVYLIIDRFPEDQSDYELIGYELTPSGYQEMQSDARGYLWLDAVQLWLGLEGNQLIYLDIDNNQIGNLDQQRQRADMAEHRAETAEQIAGRLAEKLREMGVDPESLL